MGGKAEFFVGFEDVFLSVNHWIGRRVGGGGGVEEERLTRGVIDGDLDTGAARTEAGADGGGRAQNVGTE